MATAAPAARLSAAQLIELPENVRERICAELGPTWCGALRLASHALSDMVTNTNVRTVVLDCAWLLAPTTLPRLAARFSRNVKHVIIKEANSVFLKTDLSRQLSRLPTAAWPSATRVSVAAGGAPLDGRAIAELVRTCPCLRQIGPVRFMRGCTREAAGVLARCASSLEDLDIVYEAPSKFTAHASVADFDRKAATGLLTGLTGLRRLGLDTTQEPAYLDLLRALKGLPALRELQLGACQNRLDVGAMLRSAKMDNLTKLELRCQCTGSAPGNRIARIFRGVASFSPNIRSLRLEGCALACNEPLGWTIDGDSDNEGPLTTGKTPATAGGQLLLPFLEELDVINCIYPSNDKKRNKHLEAPTLPASVVLGAIAPRLRSMVLQGGENMPYTIGFGHPGLQSITVINTDHIATPYYYHNASSALRATHKVLFEFSEKFPGLTAAVLRVGLPMEGVHGYKRPRNGSRSDWPADRDELEHTQAEPPAADGGGSDEDSEEEEDPGDDDLLQGLPPLARDEHGLVTDLRAWANGWGRLRTLELDCAAMDARAGVVLGVLAASPAASRLERLTLTMSGLGGPNAASLALRCLPSFAALRLLVVQFDLERRVAGKKGRMHTHGLRLLTNQVLRAFVSPLPNRCTPDCGGGDGNGGGLDKAPSLERISGERLRVALFGSADGLGVVPAAGTYAGDGLGCYALAEDENLMGSPAADGEGGSEGDGDAGAEEVGADADGTDGAAAVEEGGSGDDGEQPSVAAAAAAPASAMLAVAVSLRVPRQALQGGAVTLVYCEHLGRTKQGLTVELV